MLKKLMDLIKKPEHPFEDADRLYHDLWDDVHISKGMLEAHLNPIRDAASRNHAFINKSAEWISMISPPEKFPKVLDLGCGPGLYAERFAKAGYTVTGLDFSKRSVEYAENHSEINGSGIKYYYKNYMTIDYEEQFDIVTLIYCDYAALSANNRKILTEKVYGALKPGGKFIFDVFTPKMRKQESRSCDYFGNGGFYSEKPYILLESVFQYNDEDRTELSSYIVITDEDVKYYHSLNHFFTKETLEKEVMSAGFNTIDFYGDAAGGEFSVTGDTICAVLTKQ